MFWLLCAWLAPPAWASLAASPMADPIRFGVLAFRNPADVAQRWAPLADYLQSQLNGRPVVLLALTYTELQDAVAEREVDLVLTQPAHYVALSIRHHLFSPLATLVEMEQGQPMASFGGVIFTRSSNSAIRSLRDIKGRHVVSSQRDSLGSYQAQAYELMQLGIRPSDYRLTEIISNQDRIVEAVLNGEADVGFVRSGLLEQLIREGRLHPDAIHVLASDHAPAFPVRLSTRVYPQWALAAMPWLDEPTARLVAGGALSLTHNGEVAQATRISGFTIPADYRVVEDLMQALRMPPFDERVPLQVIWEDYQFALVIAMLLFLLALAWSGSNLVRLNRQRRLSRMQMQQAASVFEHASEAIMITNARGQIVDVNAAFSRITGYTRDEVLGQNPRMLSSGRHDGLFYQAMWQQLAEKGEWFGEIWNRRKNGEVYPEMLTVSAIRDPSGQVLRYIGMFSDITELKSRENELRRIAHYDALTGLPNRVMLYDRLRHAMGQTDRRNSRLGILYIDIDGFKEVNDTHGHAVGDQLLERLARRMESVLREGDTLARLGGDEFVALLMDLESDGDAQNILQRLVTGVAEPAMVDNKVLHVSASIGVTFYPQAQKVSPEQLLQQADQAMYIAKQQGKNRFHRC